MGSPGKWTQCRVTLSATLVVFSCGMQFSWSSPALEKIEDEHLFHLTTDEISWAVSLLNIGAIFGSLLSGSSINAIGRKWCLFACNGPFIIGWVLIYFATSAPWLYAARILTGLAVGMSLSAVPVYVGEIAATELRGALGALSMVMMNMGVLFEYVCGPLVTYHQLAALSCVFPILCAVSVVFIPESPTFLVIKFREDDARTCLQRLRGSETPYGEVEEELNAIKWEINDREKREVSWADAVRSKGTGKALLIVSFLGLMQQMCGNAALLAYFQGIYTAANSPLKPYIAYIIVSVLQVATGLLSSWTVDKTGRRPLFLVSCALELIAYALMGAFFFIKEHHNNSMVRVSWLPLLLIAVVLASFNLGQGPLVYVLVGEILPQEVRAMGATSAAICISVGSFAATKLYPLVSPYVAFWVFGGLVLVTLLFFSALVPETKGKTREEIKQLLAGDSDDTRRIFNRYTTNVMAHDLSIIQQGKYTKTLY